MPANINSLRRVDDVIRPHPSGKCYQKRMDVSSAKQSTWQRHPEVLAHLLTSFILSTLHIISYLPRLSTAVMFACVPAVQKKKL